MQVTLTREWLERKLKELDDAGVDSFVIEGNPPSEGTRVRAKMRCNSITKTGSEKYPNIAVQLGAVFSNDPQSENRAFANATPSASVNLNIDAGLPVAHAFALEREYYVDFTLVSKDTLRYLRDGLPPVPCCIVLCKRDGSDGLAASYLGQQVISVLVNGETVEENSYNGLRLPALGYTHWRYPTEEEGKLLITEACA